MFEVKGIKFQSGTLSAMKQVHIARRLAAVAGDVITPEAVKELRETIVPGANGQPLVDPVFAISMIMKAFGAMKDPDAEFVINECLMVCSRVEGDKSFPVMAPGGGLMYRELGAPEMLGIAAHTIWDQMGNFIPALLEALPKDLLGQTS